MQDLTPKEQEIIEKIREGATTPKEISIDLGWGHENLGNIHNYLKRIREKGYIQVVPQKIVLQHHCKE